MVIHRKKIVFSIALALGLNHSPGYAQFEPETELIDLNGNNGFIINGIAAGDHSGVSVSAAGDVNGDGIDDFIIGAESGNSNTGSSYVVFGTAGTITSPINLSNLDGSNGFVINSGSIYSGDFGASVSAAGDINGDGFDDIIIGAPFDHLGGQYMNGGSFVIFGSNTPFISPINTGSLNGSNGFAIYGEEDFNYAGHSVSGAGDVNGDGIDDIIISAPGADDGAGRGYVVFGTDGPTQHPMSLSDLNGSNGITINMTDDFSPINNPVSAAGDVNGDGIDDIIIGVDRGDSYGNNNAGISYVIFGSDEGLPHPFNLYTINRLNGFTIHGVAEHDNSGVSVSAAGDVNGDGVDDIIIGAYRADPDDNDEAGTSYVVFGSMELPPNPLFLSELNGTTGFTIHGVAADDNSGVSVSAAGDVNGDGYDDIIIGASKADPNGNNEAGTSYVVFGTDGPMAIPINLSDLNGSNGFTIKGVAAGDQSGNSVSAAGDVNDDGIDDIIIGADRADPDGNNEAGSSYVVFGQEKPIFKNGFE